MPDVSGFDRSGLSDLIDYGYGQNNRTVSRKAKKSKPKEGPKSEIKLDFEKLRKTDPIRFGELLERAGYVTEAILVYQELTHVPSKIFHAAELSFQEGNYNLTLELISLTRKAIVGPLADSPPYETRYMGEAIGRDSSHEEAKRIEKSILDLEGKLNKTNTFVGDGI